VCKVFGGVGQKGQDKEQLDIHGYGTMKWTSSSSSNRDHGWRIEKEAAKMQDRGQSE
jgi:hypothetical protein